MVKDIEAKVALRARAGNRKKETGRAGIAPAAEE